MSLPQVVTDILNNYSSETAGTRANLARVMMHGALSGTGKIMVYAVDQGFEHGPDKSFITNPAAYDPVYHANLAINNGFSAYAAPIGQIRCASHLASEIPMILKLNSSYSLMKFNENHDQAVTASVKDALRLGCVGIGLTLYIGSNNSLEMIEEARNIIAEAKDNGLCTVVWCYPRGGMLEKQHESAIDVICHAVYIACSLGAGVVKTKIPVSLQRDSEIKYGEFNKKEELISTVVRSAFNGRRIVTFSGGVNKPDDELIAEAAAVKAGGGHGIMIGRNVFMRQDPAPIINSLITTLK